MSHKTLEELKDEIEKALEGNATMQDLEEWFNRSLWTVEDAERLLKLVDQPGGFSAWDCPNCGVRIQVGRVGCVDDWKNFQGVRQDEYLGELCGNCGGKYQELKAYAGE